MARHILRRKLAKILKAYPKNCPKTGLTEFYQAMPDYKRRDPVDGYRIYYINEKRICQLDKPCNALVVSTRVGGA